MSSDIDQKKLSVATDWISKLANGINPIDGSVLPDSDVVNNVHISRCLFFVSNLLEDMGKKKHSSKKQYEQEFQITPEIASSVYIAEKTGIAIFVKEINKVIPENMKPLSASKVTQWLVSVGYLVEKEAMVINIRLQLNLEHLSELHLHGKRETKDNILRLHTMLTRNYFCLRISLNKYGKQIPHQRYRNFNYICRVKGNSRKG